MKFRIINTDEKRPLRRTKDSEDPQQLRFKTGEEACAKDESCEDTCAKDGSCEDAVTKALSGKELELIRKLLKKADALLELVGEKKSGKKDDDEEDLDEELDEKSVKEELEGLPAKEKDSDEDLLEIPEDDKTEEIEESEEVIGDAKTHDSKKSFGAIETKAVDTDDSIAIDDEIAQSWAKYYGGK